MVTVGSILLVVLTLVCIALIYQQIQLSRQILLLETKVQALQRETKTLRANILTLDDEPTIDPAPQTGIVLQEKVIFDSVGWLQIILCATAQLIELKRFQSSVPLDEKAYLMFIEVCITLHQYSSGHSPSTTFPSPHRLSMALRIY